MGKNPSSTAIKIRFGYDSGCMAMCMHFPRASAPGCTLSISSSAVTPTLTASALPIPAKVMP